MTAQPSSEKPPLPGGCTCFDVLMGGAQVVLAGCVLTNVLRFIAPTFRSEGLLVLLFVAIVPLHFAAASVHLHLARRMGRGRALSEILGASPLWLRILTYLSFLWFAIAFWCWKTTPGAGDGLSVALPTAVGFLAWMAVLDWRIFWWRLKNAPAAEAP